MATAAATACVYCGKGKIGFRSKWKGYVAFVCGQKCSDRIWSTVLRAKSLCINMRARRQAPIAIPSTTEPARIAWELPGRTNAAYREIGQGSEAVVYLHLGEQAVYKFFKERTFQVDRMLRNIRFLIDYRETNLVPKILGFDLALPVEEDVSESSAAEEDLDEASEADESEDAEVDGSPTEAPSKAVQDEPMNPYGPYIKMEYLTPEKWQTVHDWLVGGTRPSTEAIRSQIEAIAVAFRKLIGASNAITFTDIANTNNILLWRGPTKPDLRMERIIFIEAGKKLPLPGGIGVEKFINDLWNSVIAELREQSGPSAPVDAQLELLANGARDRYLLADRAAQEAAWQKTKRERNA